MQPLPPGWDVLLTELVPDRTCGDCAACCQLLQIIALDKPAGVMCQNCTGTGCAVYETRPQVCRTTFCLWRRIAALPEELRPDKSRFMIFMHFNPEARNPFDRACIVMRALDGWDDLTTPLAQAVIRMFKNVGHMPLWIAHNGEKELVYPERPMIAAIVNPDSAPMERRAEASAWRNQLAMA